MLPGTLISFVYLLFIYFYLLQAFLPASFSTYLYIFFFFTFSFVCLETSMVTFHTHRHVQIVSELNYYFAKRVLATIF